MVDIPQASYMTTYQEMVVISESLTDNAQFVR